MGSMHATSLSTPLEGGGEGALQIVDQASPYNQLHPGTVIMADITNGTIGNNTLVETDTNALKIDASSIAAICSAAAASATLIILCIVCCYLSGTSLLCFGRR